MNGRINVKDFLSELHESLGRGDMASARDTIVRSEKLARMFGDDRGLVAVLNEAVVFYRDSKNQKESERAITECLELTAALGMTNSSAGAAVFCNCASALALFGQYERALKLYEKAARCYELEGKTDAYEYSALLGNKAAVLYKLGRIDNAVQDWTEAVAVLDHVGGHGGEAAMSLIMLARIEESKGNYPEKYLDIAWERLISYDQVKDMDYAYILAQCAPIYSRFERFAEADALRNMARRIYERYSEKNGRTAFEV